MKVASHATPSGAVRRSHATSRRINAEQNGPMVQHQREDRLPAGRVAVRLQRSSPTHRRANREETLGRAASIPDKRVRTRHSSPTSGRCSRAGWTSIARPCSGSARASPTSSSRPHPSSPSSLTLIGLVRHMAEVERGWFAPLVGTDKTWIYCTEDDLDGDFDNVADATSTRPSPRCAPRSTCYNAEPYATSPSTTCDQGREHGDQPALGLHPHDRGVRPPQRPRRSPPRAPRRRHRRLTANLALWRRRTWRFVVPRTWLCWLRGAARTAIRPPQVPVRPTMCARFAVS